MFNQPVMNQEAKEFLESGLLESYLMGTCSEKELETVEIYLAKYPEVREEYNMLQEKIERSAQELAVKAPTNLKEAIISCLEDDCDYETRSNLVKTRRYNIPTYIPWAAMVASIVFSIAIWLNNNNLRNHNDALSVLNADLEEQFKDQDKLISDLESKLFLSGHDRTERILLTGNDLSPQFKTTAFWNDVARKAVIYINEIDKLSSDKCYQLWADVNGEMINLGVIPPKTGAIEVKFYENASSLNVTIEPNGGSDHPNVENIVSSQPLKHL